MCDVMAKNMIFCKKKMYHITHTAKLVEIYFDTDEFLKELENTVKTFHSNGIGLYRKPTREPQLSGSEMATILIFYHFSGMKCFEYYYKRMILGSLKSYFPKAVSYERFVALTPRVMPFLALFMSLHRKGKETGIYYGDSKKLPVCHNRRIYQHEVFKDLAQRGKSSTGWFFGFKLFLVINQLGQVMQFMVTPGNVADNHYETMVHLFRNLKGLLFADKGFISAKSFHTCFENGLKIVTGLRANMKNRLMILKEKLLLKKRNVIESVFDILMTVFDIEHTRHRSPFGFLNNLFGALIAYSYNDKLPSIISKKFKMDKI